MAEGSSRPTGTALEAPARGGPRRPRWSLPVAEPLLTLREVAALLEEEERWVLKQAQLGLLGSWGRRPGRGPLLFRWDDVLRFGLAGRGATRRAEQLPSGQDPLDVIALLSRKRRMELVLAETARLSPNQRRAIELTLEGVSVLDVARALRVTATRAYRLVAKATLRIREHLRPPAKERTSTGRRLLEVMAPEPSVVVPVEQVQPPPRGPRPKREPMSRLGFRPLGRVLAERDTLPPERVIAACEPWPWTAETSASDVDSRVTAVRYGLFPIASVDALRAGIDGESDGAMDPVRTLNALWFRRAFAEVLPPFPSSQRAELDRRLQALEEKPDATVPRIVLRDSLSE